MDGAEFMEIQPHFARNINLRLRPAGARPWD